MVSNIPVPGLLESEVIDVKKVSFHGINHYSYSADLLLFETWKETSWTALAYSTAGPGLLELEVVDFE